MAPNLFSTGRSRKALSVFILFTLIFSSIPVFMVPPVAADGDGWLDGFTYRKSHIIINSTGAGTGYQMQVTVLWNDTSVRSWEPLPSYIFNSTQTWEGQDNIYSPSIYDDGTTLHMLYGGQNTSLNDQIGYANSTDGITWTKYAGNPVISVGTGWESVHVNDPSILVVNGTWYCWYTGASLSTHDAIGLATSPDGITWTKYAGNPVIPSDNATEGYIGRPSVIYEGGVFRMWYDDADMSCLYYAESADGMAWTRYGSVVTGAILNPEVRRFNSTHLLMADDGPATMSYRAINFHLSEDGISWTRIESDVIGTGTWNPYGSLSPGLVYYNDKWYCYFGGATASGLGKQKMGLAIQEPDFEGCVSAEAHANADFSDVRFTASDGSTELSQWLEEKVDADYAKFWVKVSGNLTEGNQSIYIYYGNAAASLASNGTAVFSFFDDFDDASLDAGRWAALTGTPVESGGYLRVNGDDVNSTVALPIGHILKARARVSSTAYYCQIGSRVLGDSEYQFAYMLGYTNIWKVIAHDASDTQEDQGAVPLNAWSTHEYRWSVSGGTGNYTEFYVNDSLIFNATTNVPDLTPYIRLMQATGANNMDVDWIFVGKYVASPPEHDVWGAEEGTAPSPSGYSLAFMCFTITSDYPLYSGTWDSSTETLTFIGNYSANVTNTCGYGYPAGAGALISPASITMSSGTLIIVGIGVNATFWIDYSFDYITWNITGDASDADYDDISGELEITGCGNFTIDASTGLPSGDFFITVNGSTWDQWTVADGVITVLNVPCPDAEIVVNFNLPGEEHHCSTCGGGGPDDIPQGDNDADGLPDSTDPDDDNDGIPDAQDPRPFNWDPLPDTNENETNPLDDDDITQPTQEDFNNAVDSAFGFVPAEVRPVVVFTVMGLPVILLLLIIVGGGATVKGATRPATTRRSRR